MSCGSTCSEEETKCLLDIWADANIKSMLENSYKNSDAFIHSVHGWGRRRSNPNKIYVVVPNASGPPKVRGQHAEISITSIVCFLCLLFFNALTGVTPPPTVLSNDWTIYAHTCVVNKFSDCTKPMNKHCVLVRTIEIELRTFLVLIHP